MFWIYKLVFPEGFKSSSLCFEEFALKSNAKAGMAWILAGK